MVISVLMMVILNDIDDDVDDGVAVYYDYDNSSSGESVVDNDNNIGDNDNDADQEPINRSLYALESTPSRVDLFIERLSGEVSHTHSS